MFTPSMCTRKDFCQKFYPKYLAMRKEHVIHYILEEVVGDLLGHLEHGCQ